MSHATPVKLQIKDVSVLKKAAHNLGCTVVHSAKARLYGNQTVEGELVIKIPDCPYDVAVNRDENGQLILTTDFWGGHVQNKLGPNLGLLYQQYVIEQTKKKAKLLGHRVKAQEKTENGTIRIRMVVN